MNAFTTAYLECALWSSTDDEGNPLDDNFGIEDISEGSIQEATADCDAFQADNALLLEGMSDEQAGHDFWLTRNRHVAGFWDRGLGETGRKLTDSAHSYGSSDPMVENDGKIYLS